MSTCSEEGLYLTEDDPALLLAVPIVILVIMAILVLLGCVCGFFGWWWCYEVVAMMSTGVVIKLAIVPDVEDVILEQNSVVSTTVRVEAGEGTTVTVQEGENTPNTVPVRDGKTVKVVGTTVTEESGVGTGVTIQAGVGTKITVKVGEGTTVTVKAEGGTEVGTTVIVKAAVGTTIRVKARKNTTVAIQEGVNSPKTVRVREGKTIKVVGTTVTKEGGYFRIRQKRTVFFQTYSGHKTLHFWVHNFILPFLLSSGMLLVISYGAVFITSQWKITKNCADSNEFGIGMSCYRLNSCPPVNCTAWNNRSVLINSITSNNSVTWNNNTTWNNNVNWNNRSVWNNSATWMEDQLRGTLFCMSLSPDLVTPLVNFVGIYAVQASLMQLFTCIVNKGCCLPFSYPPCRYTTICIMNFVFTIVVLVLAVIALVTVLHGVTIFQNLLIPLSHLLFVLLSVCIILFTLAASMWFTGPKETKEKPKLKDLFCCCCRRT